jgi:hypothetical protein
MVVKRMTRNKILIHGSGTAKFKVEVVKSGDDWEHIIAPLIPGTSRETVLRCLLAFEDILKLEEEAEEIADDADDTNATVEVAEEIRQTPYGFSLFKQSPLSEESFKKLKTAVKMRFFHQAFITFCMKNGYGCKFRRVKNLTAKERKEFDTILKKLLSRKT